jgi:hypothetical protein
MWSGIMTPPSISFFGLPDPEQSSVQNDNAGAILARISETDKTVREMQVPLNRLLHMSAMPRV